MTIIKLKILHKFGLQRLLNVTYANGGLTLQSLRLAEKVMDKLEVTEEERKAVDMEYLPTGGTRWSDKKDIEKDIEFSLDEKNLIKEIVTGMSKTKKLSTKDLFLVDLLEGLELTPPEVK